MKIELCDRFIENFIIYITIIVLNTSHDWALRQIHFQHLKNQVLHIKQNIKLESNKWRNMYLLNETQPQDD